MVLKKGDKVRVRKYDKVEGRKFYYLTHMRKFEGKVLTIKSSCNTSEKAFFVKENDCFWREHWLKPVNVKVRRLE